MTDYVILIIVPITLCVGFVIGYLHCKSSSESRNISMERN